MSKLQAKDLMIGDWVCYCKSNQYYTRVNEIRCTSDGEEYYIKCHRNKKDKLFEKYPIEDFNIEILSPIPLTPEILEKSGWKSYSHENTPIYGMIQRFEIVLAWMDYYWQLCVDSTIYRKIKIRYVHELQQELKLCGIEKEVQL